MMRKLWSVLAITAVLSIGCGGGNEVTGPGPGPGTPLPAARTLNVPYLHQTSQNWCWAASLTMVAGYYGRGFDQCQVVGLSLNLDCCLGYSYLCDVTGTMQTIQQGLSIVAGLGSVYVGGSLTFDQIKNEIGNGRPIIVGYHGSFVGHAVVIIGYDQFGNVSILDPAYSPVTVPYGVTFSYGGQLVWAETLVGIQ